MSGCPLCLCPTIHPWALVIMVSSICLCIIVILIHNLIIDKRSKN